jgi:hypothetical protein
VCNAGRCGLVLPLSVCDAKLVDTIKSIILPRFPSSGKKANPPAAASAPPAPQSQSVFSRVLHRVMDFAIGSASPSTAALTPAPSRPATEMDMMIVATVSPHRYLLRVADTALVLVDVQHHFMVPVQRFSSSAPALALTEFWVVQPQDCGYGSQIKDQQ